MTQTNSIKKNKLTIRFLTSNKNFILLRISNRLVNFLKIQQKNFAFNESQLPLAKQKQAEKRKEVLAEVHPLLVQKPGKQPEVQQVSRD